MKLIPLTQGKFARVDDEDFDWLISLGKWMYNCGYAFRWSPDRHGIYMHRLIMNPDHGFVIDHINRDKLDNRRSNLRIATKAQNRSNSTIVLSKTGYKGVHWAKHASKWVAAITISGKSKYLGYWDSPEDAHRAYILESRRIFKEFSV